MPTLSLPSAPLPALSPFPLPPPPQPSALPPPPPARLRVLAYLRAPRRLPARGLAPRAQPRVRVLKAPSRLPRRQSAQVGDLGEPHAAGVASHIVGPFSEGAREMAHATPQRTANPTTRATKTK